MTIIYFDMDGVLADLPSHFETISGVSLGDSKEDGRWDRALRADKFWENIPAYKEFVDCVNGLKFNVDIQVLSAPQRLFEACAIQKVRWIMTNMPGTFSKVNIVKRHNKIKFAVNEDGTPNILVDDYIKNIDEFVAAGGIGIHHTCPMRTINALRELEYIST